MSRSPTRVSVVIPAQNAAETLPDAIRSVLAPGPVVGEAIVADDGSTDATRDVATRFAELDPRVRVVTSGARSVGGTRNVGAASARFDWVTFLDADDILPAHSVKLRVAAVAEGAEDASDWRVAAAGATRVFGRRRRSVIPPVPLEGEWADRAARAELLPFHLGSILLHRSAHERIGGFSETMGAIAAASAEDLLFVSDLLRAGVRFRLMPEPVLEYRLHASSSSGRQRAELSIAAAFARATARSRMEGGPDPDVRSFLEAVGPSIRSRRSTRAETRLRAAIVAHYEGSSLRALVDLALAMLVEPSYVVWRSRQRGFAPHEARWGEP